MARLPKVIFACTRHYKTKLLTVNFSKLPPAEHIVNTPKGAEYAGPSPRKPGAWFFSTIKRRMSCRWLEVIKQMSVLSWCTFCPPWAYYERSLLPCKWCDGDLRQMGPSTALESDFKKSPVSFYSNIRPLLWSVVGRWARVFEPKWLVTCPGLPSSARALLWIPHSIFLLWWDFLFPTYGWMSPDRCRLGTLLPLGKERLTGTELFSLTFPRESPARATLGRFLASFYWELVSLFRPHSLPWCNNEELVCERPSYLEDPSGIEERDSQLARCLVPVHVL